MIDVNNIINEWQHLPEKFSPIAFQLAGFPITWYALSYLIAFVIVYILVHGRIKKEETKIISANDFSEMFFWLIISMLIGARLGQVLFYSWNYFKIRPLEIFLPFDTANAWQFTGIRGMSYFGGVLGSIICLYLASRIKRINFWKLSDLIVPAIPLGYTFGRLGNFINGELYGKIAKSPIGMYFPESPQLALRHPNQLYEALFEGVLLFAILWRLRKYNLIEGTLSAIYLIGYGITRFMLEFLRDTPQENILITSFININQIFSLLMVACGMLIIIYNYAGKAQKPKEK